MTFAISEELAAALRALAAEKKERVESLLETAVREYLDAAAITDVSPSDLAETQMKLAAELGDLTGEGRSEAWDNDAAG